MTGSVELLQDKEVTPIEDAWDRLRNYGFVVMKGVIPEFGFGSSFRAHILQAYFESGILQPERYDVFPPDRERARDVVRYEWNGGGLLLEEHDSVVIGQRSYSATEREYPRTELLQDSMFARWIGHTLALIPPEHRQVRGTIGVNLLRTHSDVVSGPRQDDEEYVSVYVVDKHGGGAETSLYEVGASTPCFSTVLGAGEYIVFDDQQFLHDASPLVPASDGSPPYRNTIICTVNKPEN